MPSKVENKFTKGILERQAKEAKAGKSAAAGLAQSAKLPQAPVQTPAPETGPAVSGAYGDSGEAAAAAAVQEKKPSRKKTAPAVDLTEYIVREPGRTAKNKTFYLDTAVIEGIQQAAKAQQVTESKLVNDILKKILGL